MITLPKSRGAVWSITALAVGALLIIACIVKTFRSASDHYWPLLVAGLLVTCAAAPFYYYFKNRDAARRPYEDAGIQALAAAGKALQDSKKRRR